MSSFKPLKYDVEELLEQLTTNEKVSLLSGLDFWHTNPIHARGIPSLTFSDGPNGVRGIHHFNSTPTGIVPAETGLASTWDKKLIYEVGEYLGIQAKAKNSHVILGPTVNIQRGPNGGRGFESFSEDPVLSGTLAGAYVNGVQSKGISATIKHFVCNDQEVERFSSDSIITERALREIYLKPFQIAVRDSNPKSFMTSYNKVNGIHASENEHLYHILRQEWGWNGLVMSDWGGTYSTSESVNAGLDLEMPGPSKWRGDKVIHSLLSKKVKPRIIDERARELLKFIKDTWNNSEIGENLPELEHNTPEDKIFLRKLSAKIGVLLKNEDNILPLKKDKRTVVIGYNAFYTSYSGGGSALCTPYYTISPLNAIKKKIGENNVEFTMGAYAYRYLPTLIEMLSLPNQDKKGVLFKVYDKKHSDPTRKQIDELQLRDISYLRLSDYSNDNLNLEFYADFIADFHSDFTGSYDFGLAVLGTGKVFVDDKLIIDNSTNQKKGSSFYGRGTDEIRGQISVEKGKTYSIRIEFGSTATSVLGIENSGFYGGGGIMFGGAPNILPETMIAKAVELASGADQVVLITGLNKEWESEGDDKNNIKLPPYNDELISKVLDSNHNTVVVIQTGTPVELPWIQNAKALLHFSYGGNETGNGIADVLFGDENPSGKLSLSFPKKFEDNPAYLNFTPQRGRVLYGEDVFVGYRYYEKTQRDVLFPFGYGLSYTTFKFEDNLTIVADESNDLLTVSINLTNTGKVSGSEVIQIYIRQANPSIIRPIKELKGFEKVFLASGETKTVTSNLSLKYATSFWDEDYEKWLSEKGVYTILVGNSSKGDFMAGKIKIRETKYWLGV